MTAKSGLACDLNFASLFAADLAGRGRALKQMVESGVALADALDTVGLGGAGISAERMRFELRYPRRHRAY